MLSFFSMLYVFCAFGQISPAALEMTNAANTFISTLSPELKTKVLLPFSSPERTRWSNEPSSMFRRVGISVEELNDNQKIALQALVRTGLSSQGYMKVMNTIRLDDLLHEEGITKGDKAADSLGSGHYWVMIFGKPGSSQWSWRFEGNLS